jgi:hypothetical protein
MPRKPGVSNVRDTALRSNRAGGDCPFPPVSPVSRIESQRMELSLE